MEKNNITVVLPIYRDTAMTLDCIRSAMPGILAIANTRLVLINDCSPDADMQAALESISAEYPEITLLVNNSNLGFVASVNRGMREMPENDVVLLNSDVILPDDTWLARLQKDAYQADDIASVTPLSNNTTICTFPDFLQDNPLPFGLSVSAVDQAFKAGHYPCVSAPTGVGFCLFIRRPVLDQVGYFDEAAFGRGYGEENDFCQRAIKAGYRNVISPNLYAYHLGGVSFGDEKQALIDNACRIIDQRYPNYHADVQTFIGEDKLREARIYRLSQLIARTALPKILMISHGTGGGVEQHIDETLDVLGDRVIALKLVPEGDNGLVKLFLANRPTADCLYFDLAKHYRALVELLKQLGIGLLHYQHTVRFGEQIFDLPKDVGVPHIFTLHDFYLLGGNPTLSDTSGIYPGYFDENLENPMYPYPKGVSRDQFRQQHRRLIESAQLLISPSQAVLDIFGDTYQLPKTRVVPHLENARPGTATAEIRLAEKPTYNIGIFGAISREKGADLIEAMAQYALDNDLPLRFVIIGYAYRSLKHVTTTGPFDSDDLMALVAEQQIDVFFCSARWPETYSYTLSYALAAGLPIFAPNLGAFPERLTKRPMTAFFNHLDKAETITKKLYDFINANKGANAGAWMPPKHQVAEQFYLGEYLDYATASKVNESFKPLQSIDVSIQPTARLQANEKLVIKLWQLYTHPSMRWVNRVVPFRVRRGLKRLLSRQAIHDLVNKHGKQ